MANNNQNSGGGGSTILAIIIVVLVLAGIGSCSGGSDDDSSKCGSCGRTFTNSDDVSSIAWTNMCENCYDNYKFSQDLKDELKKYEERYGD